MTGIRFFLGIEYNKKSDHINIRNFVYFLLLVVLTFLNAKNESYLFLTNYVCFIERSATFWHIWNRYWQTLIEICCLVSFIDFICFLYEEKNVWKNCKCFFDISWNKIKHLNIFRKKKSKEVIEIYLFLFMVYYMNPITFRCIYVCRI